METYNLNEKMNCAKQAALTYSLVRGKPHIRTRLGEVRTHEESVIQAGFLEVTGLSAGSDFETQFSN